MATLYLRQNERELFERLPAGMRKGAEVEEEALVAFERPAELVVRMRLVASDTHPEVRDLVLRILDAVQKDEEPDPALLQSVPHESLPIVYFGMGALGLSAVIEAVLPDVQDAGDVEGLAVLTTVRHLLLEANTAVSA